MPRWDRLTSGTSVGAFLLPSSELLAYLILTWSADDFSPGHCLLKVKNLRYIGGKGGVDGLELRQR